MTAADRTEELAPVVREVVVPAPADTSFRVFVHEFDSWWPSQHHVGEGRTIVEFRIEPHVGGRCYDVDTAGSVSHWGTVLAIDPPHRIVLAWHVQGDWTIDHDPARQSEVEVTFTALEPERTLVHLEHRDFERHGDGAGGVRGGVGSPGGWTIALQRAGDVIGGHPPRPLP